MIAAPFTLLYTGSLTKGLDEQPGTWSEQSPIASALVLGELGSPGSVVKLRVQVGT